MPGAVVQVDTAMLFQQPSPKSVFDTPIAQTPVLKLVGMDESLMVPEESKPAEAAPTSADNTDTDDDAAKPDNANTSASATEASQSVNQSTGLGIRIATFLPRLITISSTHVRPIHSRAGPTPPTIDVHPAETTFRTTQPSSIPRFTFTYRNRPANVAPLSAGPAGYTYMPLWTRPREMESLKHDHGIGVPGRNLWVVVKNVGRFLKRG